MLAISRACQTLSLSFFYFVHSLIMVRSFVLSSLSLCFLVSSVLSKPVATNPTVPIPSCPAANGLEYETPAGTFVVQCSVASGGHNLHTNHAVATFQACVDQCSSTPKCIAVNYRTSSRTCILKSTFGASTPDTRSISAGLLNGAVVVPAPVVTQSLSVESSSKYLQQYATASN
jgi:PAN domain